MKKYQIFKDVKILKKNAIKIGIIGSSGAGKTTLMKDLFVQFKKAGYPTEEVVELIKIKLFKGEDFSKKGFDITNTYEQSLYEEALSNNKDLKIVLCEAPLCNGYFYASFYNKLEEALVLKNIANESINSYDILLKLPLGDKASFENIGRKETYTKSLNIQDHIFKEISNLNYNGPILDIDPEKKDDIQSIMKSIIDKLIEINKIESL